MFTMTLSGRVSHGNVFSGAFRSSVGHFILVTKRVPQIQIEVMLILRAQRLTMADHADESSKQINKAACWRKLNRHLICDPGWVV